MIERHPAPSPVHTHRRSSTYIYNVFQHLLLWSVVIRMQFQPDICWVSLIAVAEVGDSLALALDLILPSGMGLGVLLLHMIDTPRPLHTHRRSFSYIHINAIQHLLLRLQVIWMQPQPDICSMDMEPETWVSDLRVDVVGIGGGFLLVLMIEAPHSLHTHSRSTVYI
jgi:hypothetical protein